MFVDASALVAIITREADAPALADRIQRAADPITSPVAIYEAVMGIGRKTRGGTGAARADLDAFLKLAGIRVVSLTVDDATRALAAHDRYGKGTGHPAGLNMGDCFAYAVAKRHTTVLLFKGEDFLHTDLGGA